jgi:hypothetical protein
VTRALFLLGATALACAASLALGACSSSTHASPTDGGANDDAGIDAPDYHDVYPAPHTSPPRMSYLGGRVLRAPEIVTVTFQGMDTSIRDYIRDFDDQITTTPWWTTVTNGYGVGPGLAGAHVELPDVFSGQVFTEDQVRAYITSQVTSGALPFPNPESLYVFYIPNAGQLEYANEVSCQTRTFAGYHGAVDVTTDGGTERLIYAMVADCSSGTSTTQQTMDGLTYTGSHEIIEAATDPDINTNLPGGWYMPPGNDAWVAPGGEENADLCNGLGWTQGLWSVTRVWNDVSVGANGPPCLPSPTPWFFAAATVTENPQRDEKVGPNADGYVVVPKGTTRSFEIDVFSTQPLPNDLTILAGTFPPRVSGQTYDPTKVGFIFSGVTTTLSQRTAKNGDRVTMTITVAPTLHTITHCFLVRVILNTNDYHSWPVCLYVP